MEPFEDPQNNERIFTLSEANCLIPQLEQLWQIIKEERNVLINTKEEIKKASSKAHLGGGSVVGPRYIQAIQEINESLHTIHEWGVLVKDIESGLCDFPYLLDGRLVYLCWKFGEDQIHSWHEINGGFSGRQILPHDAF